MEIKITIPSDMENDWLDAFADEYKYQENINDKDGKEVPNPQTKKEFVFERINDYVKNVFVANQANGANTTRLSLIETAKNNISGATVEEVVK